MPKITSHDPDLDELPGFGPTEEEPPAVGLPDEPDDGEWQSAPEPSPSESPAPSTTSQSPSPPQSALERPSTPSPPTETSSEPDVELLDGLEYLAGGLFELVGHFLNRMVRIRRRGQRTTLWIVSDDEAEAFAAPMARIAERRLPEELKQGDAKDLIIAGSVATEYATHNAAGIPGVEAGAVEAAPPPVPAPEPAAATAPPPLPPPPPPGTEQPSVPAEAPPLISPDI
jgi:hypothetical protein